FTSVQAQFSPVQSSSSRSCSIIQFCPALPSSVHLCPLAHIHIHLCPLASVPAQLCSTLVSSVHPCSAQLNSPLIALASSFACKPALGIAQAFSRRLPAPSARYSGQGLGPPRFAPFCLHQATAIASCFVFFLFYLHFHHHCHRYYHYHLQYHHHHHYSSFLL